MMVSWCQKSWTKVTLGAERDFDMREGQAAILLLTRPVAVDSLVSPGKGGAGR